MLTSRASRSYTISLAIGAALMAAVSARATSVTSTTYASWKSYLTGSPSEADFGVIALTSYNTAAGLTLPIIGNASVGLTVTGPGNGAYKMTGVDYNSVKSLEGGSAAGSALSLALPNGGVNAFLLAVASTGGTPLTVALSDGETFSVGSGLWGISISHTVSSLLLTTSTGSSPILDDFYYGSSNLAQDPTGGSGSGGQGGPAPVAEVATSLMIAGGCLFLLGAWRRFGTPNPA